MVSAILPAQDASQTSRKVDDVWWEDEGGGLGRCHSAEAGEMAGAEAERAKDDHEASRSSRDPVIYTFALLMSITLNDWLCCCSKWASI